MSQLPKLFKADGVQGYDSEELCKYLKKKGLLKEWKDWFNGQTEAIIDGHFIIYKWDVERFLEGKPDLDIWP